MSFYIPRMSGRKFFAMVSYMKPQQILLKKSLEIHPILSRYTNADLKIYRHLCLHIKIISRRFHIITAFTFLVMRIRDI